MKTEREKILEKKLKASIEYILKTKREIQKSEAKYRSLFNTAPNLIISFDSKGTISNCNNKVKPMLGYSKKELIQKNMTDLLKKEHIKGFKKDLRELSEKKQLYNKEYKFIKKNKSQINVKINYSITNDEKEKILKCIIEDITEFKNIQKAMIEKEKTEAILKQKKEFVNLISHELIEPLIPLRFLLPLIRNQTNNINSIKNIDLCIKNTNKMSIRLKQILELSRLETNNENLIFEEINLKDFMKKVINDNQKIIAPSKIIYNYNITTKTIISLDKRKINDSFKKIFQCIYNKVKNKTKIKVEINKNNRNINFEIKGMTMNREIIKDNFDKLSNWCLVNHNNLNPLIVKKILELHGGNISIMPYQKNKVTIKISLPIK